MEIVVSERGAPSVARNIDAIGDKAEKSAIQTNRLYHALRSLGAATGVLALGRMVDQYTSLTNRLRVVTKDSAQLKVVQQELFNISNKTRTSFGANVEVFGRLALSLKDAGTSMQTMLNVTESLAKATVISGASAEEAKNALIQLSQGLASGTLRGDELRSVLEQLPIVADAIAAKLGVTRGAIRKLAEEGRLTTKVVVQAVQEAAGKWDELFKKTVPTMSQAIQVIKNRFLETIGAMDEASGASAAFAKALIGISGHMKEITGAAVTLAGVLAVQLVRYALNIAIGRMLDFLKLLIVTPLYNFAAALGTITTALVVQSGAFLAATANAAKYIASLSLGVFGFVGRIGGAFSGALSSVLGFVTGAKSAQLTFRGVITGFGQAVLFLLNPLKLVQGFFVGLTALIGGGFRAAIGVATGALTLFGTVLAGAFGAIGTLIQVIAGVGIAMVTLGDQTTIAKDKLATYKDFALAVWNNIGTGFNSLVQYMSGLWPKMTQGSTQAFGEAEGGFKGMARSIAGGLDKLVAIFQAAYDTILDAWRSFPAALLDLIIQGLVKAYNALVQFVKDAWEFLKDSFQKLISLDFDNIGAGGLDLKVEGAAARVGDVFNKNLEKRIGEGGGGALKLLEKQFDDAEKLAKERIEKANAEAEALKKARAELPVQGPDKTTPDDSSKRGRKTFEDYLNELKREQELGLAIGESYKILNEELRIANALRTDLTPQQKALVEEAVKENLALEAKRALLNEIKGPQEEYNTKVQYLTELYQAGAITLEEYNAKFLTLRENLVNALPEATTFADGFAIQIEKMRLATQNGFGQMGTEVAKIFGPGGTLINGIGDAVAQSIVFGKSFKEQIRQVAQSILSQLISALVKMGLNMVLNSTLNATLGAASTAQGVAQAGALTAAYTPAAAMASLATGGTNAAAAGSGIASIFSMLTGLVGSFGAFKEGGYTGGVGTSDVAGLVHGQEFVINAAATKRNRSLLEAINAGKDPLQPVVAAASAPSMNVAITNEIPEAAFEVNMLSETDVEIIARRVVQRDAAGIVANDLRNPNSRMSKSVGTNTTASRRR